MWGKCLFLPFIKWRLICLVTLLIPIQSFIPLCLGRASKQERCLSLQESSSSDFDYGDDEDWLNDDDYSPASFSRKPGNSPFSDLRGKSQIPEFIKNYLEAGETRPQNFLTTHLLAVPMTENHELQIELESVQRAILYHCPKLVHACITSGLSRMPLLLVDASQEPAGKVNSKLQDIVQKVVRKHCFVHEEGYYLGDPEFSGLNKDGNRPLTMKFHNLEIDGVGNQALYTVADNDANGGLKKLRLIVSDLEHEIKNQGWKTMWPPSDVQGSEEQEQNRKTDEFVPRIPFMRLPPNFEEYLDPPENESIIRLCEEGGNGISPLFWIKWEKDVMARDVRLQGIGVYYGLPGLGEIREQAFYAAQDPVRLPEGNEALAGVEKVHKEYQDKRMEKMERRILDDDEFENGDIVDPTVSENRKILESIYDKDSTIADDGILENQVGDEGNIEKNEPRGANAPLDGWMQERIRDITGIEDDARSDTQSSLQTTTNDQYSKDELSSNNNSAPMDEWMQKRLRGIVENQNSVKQQRKIAESKSNLPSLDDNPIIQAMRVGDVFQNEALREENTELETVLASFPSPEHLKGFWRIVHSPVTSSFEAREQNFCDNFVLRSDGNIAGGPILVKATRQKAGGGSWQMFETDNKTLMQLRLVIPPERERIMVWEGEISKEEIIKCAGKVWVESATTASARQELGSFCMERINTTRDPSKFRIIIPQPIRIDD
eukprot:CAMPEP_0194211256 /NCGR_PEP_ID=MMETSP0156-20130528/9834_1 /TAXON_ID=33649 /ORGANISM="Thalassionema nitzschioides, Strain L26-B" /LENGTH=717 /DNA_ID=CAMNT_0038938765 /DNA_START=21 /DNA_END=2174 /DNA_ORIENTATION=-